MAIGLGTLYTVQGGKLSNSTNIDPMQTLGWLAKNNRPQDKRKTGYIQHTFHPRKELVRLETPEDAYAYAAAVFMATKSKALEALGLEGRRLTLVPIPASGTTVDPKTQERWPALAFARALSAKGVGSVCTCLVNREARSAQTLSPGKRLEAHEITKNTSVSLLPRSAVGSAVLFVDDVITHGRRMAAANHSLNWMGPTAGLCIVFTHETGQTVDCYTPKRRLIAYDTSIEPWKVTISKPEAT
jgi:hypothetical protein